MKKLVLSLAMVLGATFAFGQELSKEELKEQKRQIKALMSVVNDAEANLQSDPVGATNALRPVLVNSLVNKDAYVWYVSASAKQAVIANENNKRVEGAAYNEELLYSYTYDLGKDLAMCEECDVIPDAKGRVKPRYAEFLKMSYMQQYGQFYNAGAYYYGNEEYNKAYDLFKMFIDTADKLYKLDVMPKDTTNVPVAAYNMALCGMQLEDYAKVLTHVDMALANEQMAPSAFRYKTVATIELGDTAAWLELCKEGTALYADDAYFSQSLIQYYDSHGEKDKLNALADDLIANDPTNPLYVYLKAYIPHQQEDLDTAIEWYNKTLEVDPNYENALSNLARCYLQKAYLYSVENSSTKLSDKKKIAKDKEVLNGYYNQALPLLERLRNNCPEKTELWLTNLINCYYNLNMDAKVGELEKLQESLMGEE
jgi:tetratricopeptide (TPR) repeat protein